jgi:hypothetical protein
MSKFYCNLLLKSLLFFKNLLSSSLIRLEISTDEIKTEWLVSNPSAVSTDEIKTEWLVSNSVRSQYGRVDSSSFQIHSSPISSANRTDVKSFQVSRPYGRRLQSRLQTYGREVFSNSRNARLQTRLQYVRTNIFRGTRLQARLQSVRTSYFFCRVFLGLT